MARHPVIVEQPQPVTTTVRGAAARSGLSERKIWALIAEKKLRAARVGRRTLPFVDSLDAILNENATAA